jgi:hypothetical protein
MRFLKLARFVLLCILAAILWSRASLLHAQYGDDCESWATIEECCDDQFGNQFCAHDNCINGIEGSTGDGYQATELRSAGCTTQYGAPPGSCADFSDYVPVDNPECYCEPRGGYCYDDSDCCDDLYCTGDGSGEGHCESFY